MVHRFLFPTAVSMIHKLMVTYCDNCVNQRNTNENQVLIWIRS